MISRLIAKIRFLLLRSQMGDFDQFKMIQPFDQLEHSLLQKNRELLKPHYDYYVKEVSREDMAISLELATCLYSICCVGRYEKILDVGSGFSSFVFRLYARETPGVCVYSVDDDEEWLHKTREFLIANNLTVKNTYRLDQFLLSKENEFDFILNDLNFVDIRLNYSERIMEISKPNGLVIFDDVHKPEYLFPLLSRLSKLKIKVFSLKAVTFDPFGRYSLAAIKT